MDEKFISVSGKNKLLPRNLNVHKFVEPRASELEALHSIISNRLHGDYQSQRSKRRRTSSYHNKALGKRKNKKRRLESENPDEEKVEMKSSRRIRRRVELKMNSVTGFSSSGDGTKRLRTHVWHAKRFLMTKLWGFHLPLGLQGRGKGSRALLKWYYDGVLVHDASYYVALQLEGPEDSLISVLSTVLVPLPSTSSHSQDVSSAIISGDIYGRAILHHVGDSVSNAVSPVTYLWRPYHCQNKELDAVNHATNISEQIEGKISTIRQLWVWLHASVFSGGYDALELACQKEMDAKSVQIFCSSLEGQLAKLEVFGSKAFQLLQKVLHPMTCNSERLRQLKKHTPSNPGGLKKSFSLENENCIPCHGIVSITCNDPRILPEENTTNVQESASVPKSSTLVTPKDVDISPINEELSSSSESILKGDSVFPINKELWDVSSGVDPPVEDSLICIARHEARLNKFCLDEPCAEISKDLSPVQRLRTCPMLLLNENNEKGSLKRWSIILPISWVKAFWIPLISKGAHAIGLRERHWIACEVGLPSFPWDFPDSSAYSHFMAKEAVAADLKAERSTPATRAYKIPIPPPWHCIQTTTITASDGVEGRGVSAETNVVCVNSLSRCDGNLNVTTVDDHHNKSFDGTVARTPSSLIDFLNEMHLGHLPLFPQGPNKNSRICELLNNKSVSDQCRNGINQVRSGRQLCFLRVLLHAYKEGVFEEGAVICAPNASDQSLWTSRSDNREKGLKISDAAVRHYFKEQSPTMWELQLPEDAAAWESHRWPIGFVTTGFVRGSKKPVAEGFCEASLLAHLREQQWERMFAKRKEEIYVLVRNLRSSAYRVALATIFLEQHEDDLEFM